MSTAELERLTEVRDALEDVRDTLAGIKEVIGIVLMSAAFYVLLKYGHVGEVLADA